MANMTDEERMIGQHTLCHCRFDGQDFAMELNRGRCVKAGLCLLHWSSRESDRCLDLWLVDHIEL